MLRCASVSLGQSSSQDKELTLDAQRADLVKVRVVDVRVDAEEPTEDRLGRVLECRREAHSWALVRDARCEARKGGSDW